MADENNPKEIQDPLTQPANVSPPASKLDFKASFPMVWNTKNWTGVPGPWNVQYQNRSKQ